MRSLQAHALPLLIAIPLGGAFVAALVGRQRRRTAAVVAFLPSAVVLLIVAAELRELLAGCGGAGPVSDVYPLAGVLKTGLGVSLYADALAKVMLGVVAAVGLVIIIYSPGYARGAPNALGGGRFYALVLLMVAGMNGVVLAGDLFTMFVFLEVASIAGYALVALAPSAVPTVQARGSALPFRCLVTGAVASGLIMFAIALVYAKYGALDMATLSGRVAAGGGRLQISDAVIAALFIGGLGVKAGLVPFDGWLADASGASAAPVGALFSGAATKCLGLYALARVLFCVMGAGHFGQMMIAVGLISAIAGPFAALGQSNLKRLFACHAVAGSGVVMIGLGLGACLTGAAAGGEHTGVPADAGRLALVGAVFALVNQAALGALLFLCAGSVEKSTGSSRLEDIGGIGSAMPVTALATTVGALAASGVPPLGGFWSLLMLVMAAALGRMYLLAGAIVLANFLVLVSLVGVLKQTVFGRVSERAAASGEAPPGMAIAMLVTAIVTVGLGVFFAAVATGLAGPVADVLASGTGYGETVRGMLGGLSP